MANLLSLQRQLQVLQVHLKTKMRAFNINPHDQKLCSEIIHLEGEVQETELNIHFAEEDAKAAPKGAAVEEYEDQTIDAVQYLALGKLTPPPESLYKPAAADEYTLQNIDAIKNNEIWDFKNREFVGLDISGDKARCKTLLLEYAQKLLKAIYFTKHLCQHEDIESHIPLDKVLEVYDKRKWEDALNDVQKKLHERILTTALLDQIISKEWKKWSTYPSRTTGNIQDEAESVLRMEVWKTYANEDIHVLTWFTAPLAESIDWVKIRRAGTPNHKTLFHRT
jgi:hypothetical protein